MTVTCGIDWAEAHHDVALVDAAGAVVARCRIDTGAQGFNELLALIAEHGGTAEDTPVALETDKNLIVVALADAGFTVYPVNPRAVARYREQRTAAHDALRSHRVMVLDVTSDELPAALVERYLAVKRDGVL